MTFFSQNPKCEIYSQTKENHTININFNQNYNFISWMMLATEQTVEQHNIIYLQCITLKTVQNMLWEAHYPQSYTGTGK